MTTDEPTAGRTFGLGDYACMEIAGEDAETFLQGQLSNDLGQLPVGGGQLSAFNDPQGRVIALLRMFRTPVGFVAALPEPLAGTVTGRLRMFVLRARVSIEPATQWRLTGIAGNSASRASAGPAMHLATAEPLWIGLEEAVTGTVDGTASEWAAKETLNGMPEVFAATSGRFVAQMLRLDQLGAVSFTKGCYVGQEVIARAHHLGRVKRHTRLYRSAEGTVDPGDPVMQGTDKVGDVVRVADDGDTRIVLAVVRDDIQEPVTAPGGDLERLPDPPVFAAP